MHNLAAGHKHFGTCTPSECALIQNIYILFIGMKVRKILQGHDFESLCTWCVHKRNAQFQALHPHQFLGPKWSQQFSPMAWCEYNLIFIYWIPENDFQLVYCHPYNKGVERGYY